MTPPDTNIRRQGRRHIWPLLGIALVVLFGVGIILYWIGEEVGTAPAPPLVEDQDAAPTTGEVESGDVEVPSDAPVREVDPALPGQPPGGVPADTPADPADATPAPVPAQ